MTQLVARQDFQDSLEGFNGLDQSALLNVYNCQVSQGNQLVLPFLCKAIRLGGFMIIGSGVVIIAHVVVGDPYVVGSLSSVILETLTFLGVQGLSK